MVISSFVSDSSAAINVALNAATHALIREMYFIYFLFNHISPRPAIAGRGEKLLAVSGRLLASRTATVKQQTEKKNAIFSVCLFLRRTQCVLTANG